MGTSDKLQSLRWQRIVEKRGAAKMHAVLERARDIPQPLIVTIGWVHDLKGVVQSGDLRIGLTSLIAPTSVSTFP